MLKLYSWSIWAHDAIPAEEWKYRNLKRVVFPIVDIIFFLSGFSAARFGIPAISEFFPDEFVDIFAYVLSLASFICLLGVSFPSLWGFEIAGKSVVLGLIIGYVVALFLLTAVGEDSRGFIFFISAVSLVFIIWRLSLLGSEWQARRVEAAAERELAARLAAIAKLDRGE